MNQTTHRGWLAHHGSAEQEYPTGAAALVGRGHPSALEPSAHPSVAYRVAGGHHGEASDAGFTTQL